MRISKDKGANFEEILFPSGVYDYEDLNEFIHQKIGKLGDGENFGINILFDVTTFKVFIQLDENYQIDFVGSGNFNILLGFEKELLKTSAYGGTFPNISNSIDNIYLKCSLLSDSIVSGKRSNVLFTFPTNTKTRSLPFKEHPEVNYLWHKINKTYISEVRFYMTATKAMEKGVEKIGEKTGELIGKKIYDKFSSKKNVQSQPSETKGEEIMTILKQENIPKIDKYQHVKDVYNDLL